MSLSEDLKKGIRELFLLRNPGAQMFATAVIKASFEELSEEARGAAARFLLKVCRVVPEWLTTREVWEAFSSLEQQFERPPTAAELAEVLEMTVEEVRQSLCFLFLGFFGNMTETLGSYPHYMVHLWLFGSQ